MKKGLASNKEIGTAHVLYVFIVLALKDMLTMWHGKCLYNVAFHQEVGFILMALKCWSKRK